MKDLTFDILDLIFGFLRSDPKSLAACSVAHPDFTPITERHQYYDTIVHAGTTSFSDSFNPIRLIELISASPQIVNYVRVLQIEFTNHRGSLPPNLRAPLLEHIACLLPRFQAIECLILSSQWPVLLWQDLPNNLRTAVEDCLRLPTLQELHVGKLNFPLSILDKNANINLLSLSGSPQITEYPDATYPQLKTLSVHEVDDSFLRPLVTWTNQRIGNLQSLEIDCDQSERSLDFLEASMDTLENLYVTFWSPANATRYSLETGRVERQAFFPISLKLSSLGRLKYLTIRTNVSFHRDYMAPQCCCDSMLLALIEVIKTASSLQHLDIEINVFVPNNFGECFDKIDFSPLTDLVKYCASLHHIGLYIVPAWVPCTVTPSRIVSLLARYDSLIELIDQGTLKIHTKQIAPRIVDRHSRSTLVQHPEVRNSLV